MVDRDSLVVEEVLLGQVKRGQNEWENPINYDLISNFSLRPMSSIPAM